MSLNDEECDIGLLEAFLRGEEDGCEPEVPSKMEQHNARVALANPGCSQQSMYSTTATAAGVKSVPMAKVVPNADTRSEKKCFSQQFVKERESHLMHKGDTDSSDDEDSKYFEEQNYSGYGRTVKHLLKKRRESTVTEAKRCESVGMIRKRSEPSVNVVVSAGQSKSAAKPFCSMAEIDQDPLFGIRIVKPLISSVTLKERMIGRQVIPLASLKRHLLKEDHSSDWVMGGVIVSKSGVRTSQKGAEYAIWRISDLKTGLKTASVFLFGKCFKELWKTTVGTVLGILNPKPLDNRDSNGDEATMSVDNPQKVMIMGTSKDFGICKARKKNGDECTSFVNLNECEYCIYHLQKAYKNCSRRMELQSPCSGRGLDKLRNKVLGKNEVFYAGQSFMAVPAKKSHKLAARDDKRLKTLSDFYKPDVAGTLPQGRSNKENKASPRYISTLLDKSSDQVKKDQERLRKLGSSPSQIFSVNADSKMKTQSEKIQTKLVAESVTTVAAASATVLGLEVPQLGRGVDNFGIVDLTPPRIEHREHAKATALKWIHKHGPIKKEDPNKIPGADKSKAKAKSQADADMSASKRFKLETCTIPLREAGQNTGSSPSIGGVNSRFQKLLEATSKHKELIEAKDNEAQEEYFDKLEKKEKLEDKMLSTYKVPCKAVRCLKCKYTAFSASELCKAEGHPLKVMDGVKRFFRCCNCGNRTVTLELIPLWSCKNCAGSHWERAPMMKEKKIDIMATLSIRGDEEMFIGSPHSGGNMNLLVPE